MPGVVSGGGDGDGSAAVDAIADGATAGRVDMVCDGGGLAAIGEFTGEVLDGGTAAVG